VSDGVEVERMENPSRLFWGPVVRFFVGGPLNGRAIEGRDSREDEAGPMAATNDYWHEWFLYEPCGTNERDWIVCVLNHAETLRRANERYIDGRIDLDEFEQAVDWALEAETMAA
jgi:hypothetical protein